MSYLLWGEKNYKAQSVSPQTYHPAKEMTELVKNNGSIWTVYEKDPRIIKHSVVQKFKRGSSLRMR